MGLADIWELEEIILDLIEEELEEKKNSDVTSINFNLHKNKALEFYTKWKRNLITEEEKQDFFKNWE